MHATGRRLGRLQGQLEDVFMVLDGYAAIAEQGGDTRLIEYLNPVLLDIQEALRGLQGAIDCVNIFGTKEGQ
jgi:hypothetical protein